jgi:hypothetical protein
MAAQRERQGRPTQFHGVPLEERAYDSQGNRLPWALEWAEYATRNCFGMYTNDYSDQPKPRGQKEEKGSFGKATRRKGSSRATRTQTPAKKENPAIGGFEAALKYDARNESQKAINIVPQPTIEASLVNKISLTKEPTQVALYGFPPEMQWAALNFYERVSGGMICEDYEREPPAERRRYQSGLGHQSTVQRRTLSKEERTMAMQYWGGDCWIKVTFDSAEAADRAIASSPHMINGYWIYAQEFRGEAPNVDQPIHVHEEDRQQGLLGAPRPSHRPATLGGSSGLAALRQDTSARSVSTLPRSFIPKDVLSISEKLDDEEQNSISTATASLATVTAIDSSGLRERQIERMGNSTFTHFPSVQRTTIRPATEALLPQLSWWERVLKSLREGGWIPGDIIGHEVPRLANGDFDHASASFYWRICSWFDDFFGCNLCGEKD